MGLKLPFKHLTDSIRMPELQRIGADLKHGFRAGKIISEIRWPAYPKRVKYDVLLIVPAQCKFGGTAPDC